MQAAAPRQGRHDSASGPISFEVGRASSASTQPRRFLQGEIAGGPGVGMAEAEQKIDVGGPGPDAVNRGQRRMRLVGRHLDEAGQIEVAALDRLCDRLERADLGRREAGAGKLGRRARAARRSWSNGSNAPLEPSPDRGCACGRELLRDHDRGEARKSVRPPAQRRPSRARQHRTEAGIGVDQARDRMVEIGFGVDEEGHDRGEASTNGI